MIDLRIFIARGGIALIAPSPVFACTLCHSDTAEAVRAAVFGHDFWLNIAMSVVPIAIIGALALFVRCGVRRQ
jgi:hypothetical protein